jgi:hypothetical protein
MSALEAIVRFPLTRSGARQARHELERLELALPEDDAPAGGESAAPDPDSRSGSRGKVLFDHLDSASRGRELLKVLPEGRDRGLTPAELARLMRPGPNGQPLKNASVRAVIRNLWRGAEHLKARGRLDSRVVQRHFDQYDRDGAGRYYLEPGDGDGIPDRTSPH